MRCPHAAHVREFVGRWGGGSSNVQLGYSRITVMLAGLCAEKKGKQTKKDADSSPCVTKRTVWSVCPSNRTCITIVIRWNDTTLKHHHCDVLMCNSHSCIALITIETDSEFKWPLLVKQVGVTFLVFELPPFLKRKTQSFPHFRDSGFSLNLLPGTGPWPLSKWLKTEL